MRIEHLHYFLTIASQKSITKAAQELYISQPALSEALRNLEKELGFPLVIRSRKGITLTENGAEFAKYAADLYQTYLTMQNHFKTKHQPEQHNHQTLHFIVTPLYARTYLQDIIATFQQRYPYIETRYLEIAEDRFFQYLESNPTLFGLILLYQESLPHNMQQFSHVLLDQSPLVACCATDSALAKQSVTEMPTESVVVFESSFSAKGFLQNDTIVTNSAEAQIHAITENHYVGVVPQVSYDKLFAQHNITAVPITPPTILNNCVYYAKGHLATKAEKLFVEYLKSCFCINNDAKIPRID